MKQLIVLMIMAFGLNAMAVDSVDFKCNLNGVTIKSVPGIKKAPEHYVVSINISVIKKQVPLYLVESQVLDAEGNPAETKMLFQTDWTPKSNLSSKGEELLGLLSFFYGINTSSVTELRAAMPTDLLDTFAYLELREQNGNVTKLGFEGINPEKCQ